jgi:hypothetical protein
MTGLDIRADALVEVAALVTDFDLNVLGDGVDVVIKPPPEALDEATAGIGALLAIFSLLGVVLAVVAVIAGVNAILKTGG